MALSNLSRPKPMSEYQDGPVMQTESLIDNADYFRSYVIPTLFENREYVTIKLAPLDPTLESYSVLIKIAEYKKSLVKNTLEKIADACSKYTDYKPIQMEVSEIIGQDMHGANIRYSTFTLDKDNNWIKSGKQEFYIRTEDSLRKEKDVEAAQRKETRDAKSALKATDKTAKSKVLKGFSLEMIEKIK
jgi:hypothetical protein